MHFAVFEKCKHVALRNGSTDAHPASSALSVPVLELSKQKHKTPYCHSFPWPMPMTLAQNECHLLCCGLTGVCDPSLCGESCSCFHACKHTHEEIQLPGPNMVPGMAETGAMPLRSTPMIATVVMGFHLILVAVSNLLL